MIGNKHCDNCPHKCRDCGSPDVGCPYDGFAYVCRDCWHDPCGPEWCDCDKSPRMNKFFDLTNDFSPPDKKIEKCPGCGITDIMWKVWQGETQYYKRACFRCTLKPDVMAKIKSTYAGQGWSSEHYAAWEQHNELHRRP